MREEPHKHQVTRYQTPDGKRCKASDPGVVKVGEDTVNYYGELEPLQKGTRPERVSLETADLGTAWAKLKELRKLRARELEGLADPSLGAARRTLQEHLTAWQAVILADGATARHAHMMLARLQHLAELGHWTRLSDVTAGSATIALGKLQAERSANVALRYKGRSAQTRNHYLSHLKQFLRWCVADGRLNRNPIETLTRTSVETDRRHDRRLPSDAEVKKLFDYLASPSTPSRNGMSGPCRALAYQVAMATGLRGNEIRVLTRESFDLDQGIVCVQASYSKHRRTDRQVLPAWLVGELQAWFASDGTLWEGLHPRWPGRPLKADLLAAGVAFEVEGPEGPLFLDFHALRHWFVTQLASQPGISPKTLLALARHSTPELTLKIYAKARESGSREAVENIPRPGCTPVQENPVIHPTKRLVG